MAELGRLPGPGWAGLGSLGWLGWAGWLAGLLAGWMPAGWLAGSLVIKWRLGEPRSQSIKLRLLVLILSISGAKARKLSHRDFWA